MAVYTTGIGSSRKSSQTAQEKKQKEEEEKKKKEEEARKQQQQHMQQLQKAAAKEASSKKKMASSNGGKTSTVRANERATGDWEHDSAVVQSRLAPYSRANLSRQNARQQKTESYMDLTTANEPKARAGIEMYKARSDAQKYAEMNRVGYRNYDQDTVNRSVKGYEESYQRWKKVYDANKGPAAVDPKTSRQSEIRAQAQTIQRHTDTGTGGKDAREDDKRWAGVTSELKRLGRQQRNVDTPGAKRTWAEENRPDEVRSRYQDLYDKTFRRDEPEQKAQTVSERYTAANGQLRAAERDAYYWEQAAKDAAWFGDEQRFTRSLPHITESGRRAQGALAQFRAASDELAGAVHEEDEKLKQGDLATWYARNLTDEQIRRRLEEEQKPISVTDKDRAENPGMYPDAAFRTMPRQASFDPTMTAGGEEPGDRFHMSDEERRLTEESDRFLLQQKVNDREVQIAALERAQQAHHERDLEQEVYGYALRGHLSDMAKQGQDALRQDVINAKAHGSNPIDVLAQSGSAEEALALFRGASAVTKIWRNLMKCSDDQKERVYAMYSVDPQKAVELSQKYYDDAMDAYYAQFYNWANSKHGWQAGRRLAAGLLGTGAKLLSGFDPFGDAGQDLSRAGEAFIGGASESASRNGLFGIEVLGGDESPISGNVPFIGRGRAGEAVQLGTSILESAAIAVPAMMIGRYDTAAAKVANLLGTTLMGSSAAADDYRESIRNGLTESQALAHATAAGIAEAAFEYISLDRLIDPGNIKKGLIRWLTQGGIEASEEVCTTIANRISDEVIANFSGIRNSIEREALEYQLHGYSAEEAEAKAQNQWLSGLLMDGLSGFMSGLIMGGGSEAFQSATGKIANTMAEDIKDYRSGSLLGLESAGYTNTDTMSALSSYAEANGIDVRGLTDVQAKALEQSQEQTETTVPVQEQTETTELVQEQTQTETAKVNQEQAPTEQAAEAAETAETAETKETPQFSRRELRKAGKVRSQIVNSITQKFEGLTAAEKAAQYDSLVEQYGSGIEAVATDALYNAARQDMRTVTDVTTLEQRHGTDAAAFTSETARQTMERAYRDTQQIIMRETGDTTRSSMDSLAALNRNLRKTDGATLNLQAEVTGEDGGTKAVSVRSFDNEGKRVVLEDGSKVDVKDLTTDADTKSFLQAMQEAELGEYTNEAFQTFLNTGTEQTLADGIEWITGYRGAFGVGEVRGNITNAIQLAARYGLDTDTAAAAYYQGVKASDALVAQSKQTLAKAQEMAKSQKQTVTGRRSTIDVSAIEGVKMTNEERRQFNFANKIFSMIGVDLRWVASDEKNGRFVGANGSYLHGVVTLDIHAGRNFLRDVNSGILATTGHELTHFLQEYAPEQYRALKEFLFQQIVQGSANGEAMLERLIWEKQRRASSKLSRRAAQDEVVADACQTMLRDSKAIREFAQQDEEAAKGIASWLDKWFGKLKQAFSRSAQLTEEARFVDSFAKDVREAFGNLWDEALREAVETHDRVGNIEKTQQQNSDRDTEYLELAKDPEKNAARLQEMVDERAREAGAMTLPGGKRKPYYHGTAAKFTSFDINKSGDGTFGYGFYFTPVKSFAQGYGPVKSYYIMTDRIATWEDHRITPEQVLQIRSEYGLKTGENDVAKVAKWLENAGDSNVMLSLESAITRNTNVRPAEFLQRFREIFGYDGLRQARETVLFDNRLIKSADPVTYDDDGNVIPLSERFNEANEDIRFSMREPVERTDRLIAWHNMNEDALRSALELGGLAMPSWAIKTADRAHTSYGSISVIAPRALVDPKINRSSMIFGGDAWTPVFPGVDYKISYDAAENLENEIKSLIGENLYREIGGAALDTDNIGDQLNRTGGDLPAHYKNHEALRLAYLKSIGQDVAIPTKEKALDRDGMISNGAVKWFANHLTYGKKSLDYYREMYSQELMKQDDLLKAISDAILQEYKQNLPEKAYEKLAGKYAPEELSFHTVNGMLDAANEYFTTGIKETTDKYALGREIDKVIDEAAYEKWISEKLNSTIEKKGIRNDKETFTPSGNRRSFDQLHYAYNLANIVKAMKSQPKQGRTQFLSGPGSVKGAALKSYNTVDQVRNDRGRLVDSEEEGKAAYDAYNKALEDILDRMGKDRFETADALVDVIQHAKTEDAIYRYMERELKGWYNVSRDLASDIYKLIGQINQLPMEYFEGKTYDAVRFDETAAVVVPDNIDPALKQQLEDAGANVVEYKAGDDSDRLAKVNSVEGVQFSERDYEQPSDMSLMMEASQENVTNEEQRRLLKEYKDLGKRAETLRERLDRLNQEKAEREASGKDYKEGYLKIKDAEIAKLEREIDAVNTSMEKKLLTPQLFKVLEAERDAAAKAAAQRKNESFARYKEGKKQTELRGKIKNLKNELQRRLAKPTERSWVPAGLATSMVDVLEAIDNRPAEGTKAAEKYDSMADRMRKLADAYESIKTDKDVGWEYSSEYDEALRDQIKNLSKTLNGRNLRELSAAELQEVYDTVKTVRDTMRDAAKLIGKSKWANIYEAVDSVVRQQQSMTPIADVSKAEARKRRRLLGSLSPMRAVEMMSGWNRNAALYDTFQAVEQGTVDEATWVMEYNKSMTDLKTGKNEKTYRDALTKKEDYGAKDKNTGKPVKMTRMQAIQIYMTWQREQANDKLVHLQKGGATIRDALAVMDGKSAKAESHTVDVNQDLIGEIGKRLTDWDRAYMKTVRDYLKREAKETNRVLYQIKHKVLTTEDMYVPYKVDSAYLDAKLEGNDVFNLFVKTPGSTQELQTKAPQPVIIDGMDTLMNKHVQEQARYIGLAIPIRNFAKVFNGRIASEDGGVYTSLKKTIEDNFGSGGTHLLLQSLLDVQGGSSNKTWTSQLAEHMEKLQSMFYSTALLINPSVTIKQAASYIAAESVLSHTALERGNHNLVAGTDKSHAFGPGGLIRHLFLAPNGSTAQRIYNEIDEHTSMHYQRRQGMSYAELANAAKQSGPLKRLKADIGARMEQNAVGSKVRKAAEALSPLQWIQRMDVATTAALWVASKEQAKMDGMKVGTEEFWKKTTELYERCLRETQPMYDGLHRTAHQKQGGGILQYLFPFRTVPIQNHGQLVASYEAFKAAKNKSIEEKQEASRFFRKTVWAQTESAVVFSFMTFLAAALKRKTRKYRDDEDEELTAGSVAAGIGKDVLSTLFSVAMPMMGSELWSIGERAIDKFEGNGGYSYDAFSVGMVDMLNDLATAGDSLLKDAGKMLRGENVDFSDVKDHALKLLLKGAKLAGIPADTVKTYLEGAAANIEDIREGRIPALNDESWERAPAVNAGRYFRAYLAGNEKKAENVMAELRRDLAAKGKNEAEVNEAIRSYMTEQAVEKVADGSWTEEEAEAYMLQTGAYDDRDDPVKFVWNAIRKGASKADYVEEHGSADDFSWKQYDELADAVEAGEGVEELIEEYRAHGYTGTQINGALRSSIQDALEGGRFTAEQAIDALVGYGVTYSKNGKSIAYDESSAWLKVQEWAAKAGHEDDEDFSYSMYDNLRGAIEAGSGIDAAMKELTDHGVKEADVNKQINNAVKDLYTAGEITEKQAISLLTKYHKVTENKKTRAQTADEAWAAIQEWTAKAAHEDDDDYSYSKYEKIDAALDKNADVTKLIKELTDHGEKASNVSDHIKSYLTSSYVDGKMSEDAFKNRLSRYCGITKTDEVAGILKDANCKKDCGYGWSDLKNAYGNGDLSASAAKKMLQKHGGLSAQGAEHRLGYWDYCKKNPDTKVSAESWDAYYDKTLPTIGGTLSSRGLKQNSFTEYLEKRARLEITDLDGDGKNDKKAYYVSLIDSLNISSAEKDALYYYENYGAKDLRNMPWH